MNNRISTLGLAAVIALTVIPVPFAFAYLSPGEVFDIGLPPNKRGALQEVTQQKKEVLRDRYDAQDALTPTIDENHVVSSSASSVPSDATHGAATQSSSVSSRLDLLTDEGQFQRRLEREQSNQSPYPVIYIQNGQTTVKDAQGRVLHSGAPRTASTGPADVMAAIVLFVAGTATFLWAQRRQRGIVGT
jgi:hypothetical protein